MTNNTTKPTLADIRKDLGAMGDAISLTTHWLKHARDSINEELDSLDQLHRDLTTTFEQLREIEKASPVKQTGFKFSNRHRAILDTLKRFDNRIKLGDLAKLADLKPSTVQSAISEMKRHRIAGISYRRKDGYLLEWSAPPATPILNPPADSATLADLLAEYE